MTYNVNLSPLLSYALFDLKGPPADLIAWTSTALPEFPDAPSTWVERDEDRLCMIGPEHWLLRMPLHREAAVEAALKPTEAPPEISIVNISDSLSFFEVSRSDAAEVMSIGCPLDLHPSAFGSNAVTFTEFFGIKALVYRRDDGFEVAVDRSYAEMIGDYLNRTIT